MAMATSMAVACARSSLFEHHAFVRLLELPAASSSSSFSLLQTSRGPSLETINGVVTPDLPIKASLIEYFHSLELKHLFPSLRQKSSTKEVSEFEASSDRQLGFTETLQGFNCWQVRTVAAQTRSLPQLQERMVKASNDIEVAGCGGSLLLLSGGHPLRRVWFANQLLPANSFAMLKAAQQLRKSGLLFPGLQLWCVENPLINSVERLEKKINAGAEAVIVQPPLLPDRFAEWWSKAEHRGLTKAAPVIVGLPLLSSSRNYSFWIELTGASGKEADAMKARWRRIEAEHAGDSVAFAGYCYEESVHLIETIRGLPGVAGIHVMPVTRAGWRQYQKLVGEGPFCGSPVDCKTVRAVNNNPAPRELGIVALQNPFDRHRASGICCTVQYTHFTSPIRRYADVIVHRLLATALSLSTLPPQLWDASTLTFLTDNLNYQHCNAQMAGRASVELHTIISLKKRFGIKGPIYLVGKEAKGSSESAADGMWIVDDENQK